MRSIRTLALLVLWLLSSAGCVFDPTEVFVVIDTDAPVEQVMFITATVRTGTAITGPGEAHTWRRGGTGSANTFDAGRSDTGPDVARAIMLPASFAVTPGENRPRDGEVTLVIDAVLEGRTAREPAIVFRRISRFTFTPRTRTMVQVFLSVSCGSSTTGCRVAPCSVSQRCEEMDMTCGDRGVCVSRESTPVPVDPPETGTSDVRRDISAGDIPCSMTCPAGPNGRGACLRGVCGFACTAGFGNCNGTSGDGCETNTDQNPDHCGACGHRCLADQSCSRGSCVNMCPPGETSCSRSCVDLRTEEAHCGTCGSVCPAAPNTTATCSLGTCSSPCAPGFTDCDRAAANGCEVNTSEALANCGVCGNICAMRPNSTSICRAGVCALNCRAGTGNCNGDMGDGCETDIQTSLLHCGMCGNPCPPRAHATSTCNGTCGFTCDAGFADCDMNPANGCEANLASDEANCMRCGNVCPTRPGSVPRCTMGVCGVGCGTGLGDCNGNLADGCETSTNANLAHCGTCGNACPTVANSSPSCAGGQCMYTCSSGFADCNMTRADGCEVNTRNDEAHCGACGRACNLPNATPVCSAGACSIQGCAGSYFDVNGTVADGCECMDSGGGPACGTAMSLGSLAAGASAMSPIGRLPPTGSEDWYRIDFPMNANFAMHGTGNPRVTFAVNDGAEFVFAVFGPACAAGTCPASLTSWGYLDNCVAGDNNCTTRNAAWPSTVFIRVTRPGSAASCSTYQLAVAR